MVEIHVSVTGALRQRMSCEEQPESSSPAHHSDVSQSAASSGEGVERHSGKLFTPCCSSSSDSMGFHPEKYGCPTAKGRFSDAGQDQSDSDCDPGWYPLLKRPVSQQSSYMSRASMQGGVRIQSGNDAAPLETKHPSASVDLQTSGVIHRTEDLQVCGPSEAKSILSFNMPSLVPVVMTIPGFDKKAYGDPTRRGPSQPANATREIEPDLSSASRINSEAAVVSQTTANPNLDHLKTEPNPQGPQASSRLPTAHFNSFRNCSTDSVRRLPTEDVMIPEKFDEHQKRSVTAISQMNSAKMSGPMPRAETFETLKQGSETPEQLIARLQAEGTREAFQRIKRKDHGENITTTALTTLDLLRKPLQPESDGLQQRVTSLLTRSFPDPIPNHPGDRSNRNGGELSGIGLALSKQDGKVKSGSETDEMNPAQLSNGEDYEEAGSDIDSTKPMAGGFGRLIRGRNTPAPKDDLVGWDGNFQPPPLDWENRPSFYNNTPEYISGFSNWLGANTTRTMSQGPEIDFSPIPPEEVKNLNNHADGIGFAPIETVIDTSNADRYGFTVADLSTIHARQPADFCIKDKVDPSDPDNKRYKNETAQDFIKKRIEYLRRERREPRANVVTRVPVEPGDDTVGEEDVTQQERTPAPITSKNIYLRPAVNADIEGMKAILNWHIAQGIRPSELAEISDDEMRQRLDSSTQARLPYIVAVERSRKNTRAKSRKGRNVNTDHPIQNIDPNYDGVVKDESIVGWASATDWAAADYIETITVELELYVAPSHRKSGVGRCLMDALLDATDRGYMKKGGYDFRVAPEMKHLYSGGGGRDLHKLVFQVRSFNKTMPPQLLDRIRGATHTQVDPPATKNGGVSRKGEGSRKNSSSANARKPEKRKDYSRAARLDDREDDYEIWLKDWLEGQGFEEEAHLKKLGTKKGRFVDVRYLTRETSWQPVDHRLPDFSKGL